MVQTSAKPPNSTAGRGSRTVELEYIACLQAWKDFCKVEMLYGLDGASKTMADGKQLDMLKSYGITFRAYYEL